MSLTEKQLETRRRNNAKHLSDTYLDCRLIHHHWVRVADTNDRPPMFGIRVCYECQRCGSTRCDNVQRTTGQLLARSYDYADGYQLETIDGDRPLNADAMRYEVVRRIEREVDIPGVPALGEAS